jgi:hypothetical protein
MRMPFLAAAVAVAGLAACDISLPGGGTRSLALFDGAVLAQGPEGFCVDPLASRPSAGFAVLGSCGLLAGGGRAPQADGFITIQVGAPGTATVTGSETDLATLLRLPMGAALLTEAGDPATVTIGQIEQGDGLVSVRFSDRAPPPVAGLGPEEWRAFLDLGDRLVTVGLRGYARAPLAAAEAQDLLYDTVAALRAANPPVPSGDASRSGAGAAP